MTEDSSIDPATAALKVLSSQLVDAFQSNNVDKVKQIVNNIATSVSAVNCSLSTDCEGLNRLSCLSVAQTCGPCKDGFIGVYIYYQ